MQVERDRDTRSDYAFIAHHLITLRRQISNYARDSIRHRLLVVRAGDVSVSGGTMQLILSKCIYLPTSRLSSFFISEDLFRKKKTHSDGPVAQTAEAPLALVVLDAFFCPRSKPASYRPTAQYAQGCLERVASPSTRPDVES